MSTGSLRQEPDMALSPGRAVLQPLPRMPPGLQTLRKQTNKQTQQHKYQLNFVWLNLHLLSHKLRLAELAKVIPSQT